MSKPVDLGFQSWEDISKLDVARLKQISEGFDQAQRSGNRQKLDAIAPFRVLELEPDIDHIDQRLIDLKYLQNGDIESIRELGAVRGKKPVAVFSRVRSDKKTALQRSGRGKLIEAIRIFDDGTDKGARIRTFHHIYDAERHRKKRALRGQEFYFGLAEYIQNQLADPGTPDERILANYIGKLKPEKPLHVTKRGLHDVFHKGEDLTERLKNIHTDEKLRILEEVSAIDIITSVFSRKYRNTREGKRLFKKKLFRSRSDNYRLEVFEKILVPSDKRLSEDLKDRGLIKRRKKLKAKEVDRLCENNEDLAGVMMLLDADTYTKGDIFFSPADLNIGNTIANGSYTTIDFEKSKEEEIFRGLAQRFIESGLYYQTNLVDEVLLPKAFETYNISRRAVGLAKISKEEFDQRYNFHKKVQLLRTARRYKVLAETDENPDRMNLKKEVFYDLFVEQLVAEGKVTGVEDEKLTYLNRLFSPQGDLEGRLWEIFGATGEDPTHLSINEIKPQGGLKIKADIAGLIRRRRLRFLTRLGAGALGLAALAAAFGLAHIANEERDEAMQETVEMEKKYEDAEQERGYEQKVKIIRLYQNKVDTHHLSEVTGLQNLQAWINIMGEQQLGIMAFIDYKLLYEIMQETGYKDAKSLIGHGRWEFREPHPKHDQVSNFFNAATWKLKGCYEAHLIGHPYDEKRVKASEEYLRKIMPEIHEAYARRKAELDSFGGISKRSLNPTTSK